jgi:hypothetical protein
MSLLKVLLPNWWNAGYGLRIMEALPIEEYGTDDTVCEDLETRNLPVAKLWRPTKGTTMTDRPSKTPSPHSTTRSIFNSSDKLSHQSHHDELHDSLLHETLKSIVQDSCTKPWVYLDQTKVAQSGE